jgi:hypothetical protein
MRILGIDPGVHGGLAVVSFPDPKGGRKILIDAIDIPVVGLKAKERVDVSSLIRWVKDCAVDYAVIERAQAMPAQGASSGFKYGRATGAIEAAVECMCIPVTIIEASAWKKFHNLLGHRNEKEPSRQRALEIFRGAEQLARKKDHGRAEAALMAIYYYATAL